MAIVTRELLTSSRQPGEYPFEDPTAFQGSNPEDRVQVALNERFALLATVETQRRSQVRQRASGAKSQVTAVKLVTSTYPPMALTARMYDEVP